MKLQKSYAFVGNYGDTEAVGNMANVVLFSKKEKMTKDIMSEISAEKFPITSFIRPRSKANEFDLRYYTKDGKEFGLCGHGTICAASVIKEINHIKSDKIFFHLSDRILEVLIKDDLITIRVDTCKVRLDEDDYLRQKLCAVFNVDEKAVTAVYRSPEINDYILCLKDSKTLRSIVPNLDLLEKFACEFNSRVIGIISASELEGIDVEVRVFSHLIIGKEEGSGEDVVCGSINCSIASILNKEYYVTLFPYQYNSRKNFGGIQIIKFDKANNKIDLSGKYKIDKETKQIHESLEKTYEISPVSF